MKVTRDYPKKARIEMIPLMDVIFLLLVAFIMMTMSMTVARGIPVELPASAAAEVEKRSLVTISLLRDGTLYLDRKPVPLPLLREHLTPLARREPPPRILLSGDKEASYDLVLSVIDEIRKAGITAISLETKWEQ
jgi:biopolymer transport protein ExbD